MILVYLSVSYSRKIDVAFDATCPLIDATLNLDEQLEVSYNGVKIPMRAPRQALKLWS